MAVSFSLFFYLEHRIAVIMYRKNVKDNWDEE